MSAITPVLPALSVQPVQLAGSNWGELFRRAALCINAALRGKLNATLQVTLAASQTASTFTDSRIGINTFVGLMPMTANAAMALAAGIYVVVGAGTCAIHHASNAATDQTFGLVLIG